MKQINDPFKILLTLVFGLLVLHLITDIFWLLYLALILAGLGVLSERVCRIIADLWMGLGWLIGLFVPKVVLTLIFFLILTPLAFFSRLFSEKDELQVKVPSSSVFKTMNKEFSRESFEKPW